MIDNRDLNELICSAIEVVGGKETMYDFNCPYCNRGFDDDEKTLLDENTIDCPTCNKEFKVVGEPCVEYTVYPMDDKE